MNINYIIYAFMNKLFKVLNITYVYINKHGVKSLNQLTENHEYQILEKKVIDGSELHLGMDALKDKYTLFGTKIPESPHYNLMEKINNRENISNCEYMKRQMNGCLDGRNYLRVDKKIINIMMKKYAARKKQILQDNYAPVQVYLFNGKYYIADGKHRAALCCYLNKPIKCNIISQDFLVDSFRLLIIKKMYKNKEFSKHSVLFGLIAERRKK